MPKISDEQRLAARQKLIDAAIAIVERDGVDALTTRALVGEAGVSAGMFYGHFESKEALLAAVVDQKVEEFTTLVSVELEFGAPLDALLRRLLRHLVGLRTLGALALFRGVATSEDAQATHRDINRRIVEAFSPFIRAAVDVGLIRESVDAEAAVEVIDMLLDGLNRRRANDGFVTDDERVSTLILDAIERFLISPQEDHPQ